MTEKIQKILKKNNFQLNYKGINNETEQCQFYEILTGSVSDTVNCNVTNKTNLNRIILIIIMTFTRSTVQLTKNVDNIRKHRGPNSTNVRLYTTLSKTLENT